MWAPLLALQFIVSACRGRAAALQVSVTSPGLKVVIAWDSRIPQSERSSRGKDNRTAAAQTGGKKRNIFCFSAMAMFIACGWTSLPAFYQVWTFIIILVSARARILKLEVVFAVLAYWKYMINRWSCLPIWMRMLYQERRRRLLSNLYN